MCSEFPTFTYNLVYPFQLLFARFGRGSMGISKASPPFQIDESCLSLDESHQEHAITYGKRVYAKGSTPQLSWNARPLLASILRADSAFRTELK